MPLNLLKFGKIYDQMLVVVQEVQSLVCCYLHEAFIAEPTLAKLVHFQVRMIIWGQLRRSLPTTQLKKSPLTMWYNSETKKHS